jgi:hypothetical protein
MLGWLKQKTTPSDQSWIHVQQPPGVPFPFPRGTKLRPDEEVILALPKSLITENERIDAVLLCDDDAEFTLNEEVGAYYVKLKPGMMFDLAKSCEIMLIARDARAREFHLKRP